MPVAPAKYRRRCARPDYPSPKSKTVTAGRSAARRRISVHDPASSAEAADHAPLSACFTLRCLCHAAFNEAGQILFRFERGPMLLRPIRLVAAIEGVATRRDP